MAFSFSFLFPFDSLLSVMEPTGRAVGGHFVFSLRASFTLGLGGWVMIRGCLSFVMSRAEHKQYHEMRYLVPRRFESSFV